MELPGHSLGDLAAVETAVLDKDLVGMHACHDHTG